MLKGLGGFLAAVAVFTVVFGGVVNGAEVVAPVNSKVIYVAPEALGEADGSSPQNAAYFRDYATWSRVQRSLLASPVTVHFASGQYIFSIVPKDGRLRGTLRLEWMGNAVNQLVLEGEDGTVFTSDPAEPVKEQNTIDMLYFNGRNTVFRNLHFTGQQHMGYATRFLGQDLLIEDCTWIDLPRVYYGATGTAYETSHHITFKDCVFKRVGLNSHAHMIYNAYGPKYVNVINSYFEDCSGEYVRFRDQTDYTVVYGNTFKSTGTYVAGNTPFISVPLFNDNDPKKPVANPRYEYFGTHILVANNTFIYPDNNTPGTRQVFRFLHRGFDPPGRHHLLNIDDAKVLINGSIEEKRTFMQTNLGIDGEQVHFYGNTYQGQGARNSITYDSAPDYGAVGRGWTSPIDITATVNAIPVVANADEAMMFWERK